MLFFKNIVLGYIWITYNDFSFTSHKFILKIIM